MKKGYTILLFMMVIFSVSVLGDCFYGVCYDANICVSDSLICSNTSVVDNNDSTVSFFCGIDDISNCSVGCFNSVSVLNASHNYTIGSCAVPSVSGDWWMSGRDLGRSNWDGVNFWRPYGLTTKSSSVLNGSSLIAPAVVNESVFAVGGSYLYRFNASNVSQLIAQSGNLGTIQDFVVIGDYAFVVNGANLYKLFVSNLSVHSFTNDGVTSIVVVDGVAYVSGSGACSHVDKYNLSNLSQPFSAFDPFGCGTGDEGIIYGAGSLFWSQGSSEEFYKLNLSLGQIGFLNNIHTRGILVFGNSIYRVGNPFGFYKYDVSSLSLSQYNVTVVNDFFNSTVYADVGSRLALSVADSSFYVSARNGSGTSALFKINKDDLGDIQAFKDDVLGNPLYYDGKVFVRSKNNRTLYVLNSGSLADVYSVGFSDVQVVSDLAFGSDYVYFVGNDSRLYQVNVGDAGNISYVTQGVNVSPSSVGIGGSLEGSCLGLSDTGSVGFLVKWFLNGVEFFSGSVGSASSGVWHDVSLISNVQGGQSWIFSCSVVNSSVWLNSSSVVVGYSGVLNVSNLSLSPASIYANSSVSCNWNLQSSNSSVSSNVSWFLNGGFVSSEVFSGLSGSSVFNGSKVNGDVLECKLNVSDGFYFNNGSVSNAVSNSPHVLNGIGKSVSNLTLFGDYSLSAVVSDLDNDVVSVNFSVLLPNGTSIVGIGSLVNGSWVSGTLVAELNGSYVVSVLTDDNSFLNAYSFSVLDSWLLNPDVFVGVVSAGGSFVFNLSVDSGSSESLSFNSSFVLPSGFNGTFSVNPVSVVGSGLLQVVISVDSNVSEGNYTGNISVTRLRDGRVIVLPLSLGVASGFGQPFVSSGLTWSTSVLSSQSASNVFTINNTGVYTLSGCVASLGGDFVGWGFVQFSSSDFNISVGGSYDLSLSLVSPPASTYRGYLQVVCESASGGQLNGLSVGNRPYVQLVSSSPISPPSAGAGAGSLPVVSYGNVSLFVASTDSGSSSADLFMYPSQVREQLFVVTSKVANDLNLKVSCSGNMCPYVILSKTSFKLVGFGQELVSAKLSLPSNVAFDSTFTYDLVVTDGAGYSSNVRSVVSVSKFSKWYSKYSLIVKEGDSGFWFSLGGVGVPKLVLYLLLVLLSELVAYGVMSEKLRSSDAGTIVYLLTGLLVFIFGSALL